MAKPHALAVIMVACDFFAAADAAGAIGNFLFSVFREFCEFRNKLKYRRLDGTN